MTAARRLARVVPAPTQLPTVSDSRHRTRWPESNECLEMWAGPECTIARVGDEYHDQFEWNGHYRRPGDIERFAALGIDRIRYPVLWERHAPVDPRTVDFRFSDERLGRLRAAGVAPIVGLTHHGSGPRHTSLVDPEYPRLFARYAARVAERYPWVDAWTPVNEILTTARFSGMYGHWYPHGRDMQTFVRALVNEATATVLAMREIRKVNPNAKLIATDDLGRVVSTRHLTYQADLENERRFLSWDLLCGRVTESHPLWAYLKRGCLYPGESDSAPFEPDRILWLANNPCPPDLIGVNHYLTSERYLDEDEHKYPEFYRGGNEIDRYGDTELVWMDGAHLAGPEVIIEETWLRYGIPIAITEAHLTGGRESSLRWLAEVWSAAEKSRAAGIDVVAVTAWSLLGTYDWNRLLTEPVGFYEPGVFDVRSDPPRPTALASMVKALAEGERPHHPVLAQPGWWRTPSRVRFPLTDLASPVPEGSPWQPLAVERPVLITGGAGTLGSAFARRCAERGIAHRVLRHSELDIADETAVEALIAAEQPWAIVNAAGYVRVDDAEGDRPRCMAINAYAPSVLARACARADVKLALFSSDLVFDGLTRSPYAESSRVAPLSCYGESKVEMERLVSAVMPEALIVRTSAFFGPWDEYNFLTIALRALQRGERVQAAWDMTVSPTYVPDLVDQTLDLLIDGETGVWHLANEGVVSWFDFAREGAKAAGMDPRGLIGVSRNEMQLRAPRPVFSAMRSERATIMPPLDEAISRFTAAVRV